MSVFPVNRVPDILKRMDLNSSQAEAMKTCFGILAIMSREDSNKLLIAKDGMEIILNAMTVHVDRTDVQESGCDLLWSLAFNSSAVKDIIAKYGGSVVLVRALKRHSRSADFLKSACGALSNMCQSKLNQEGVSSQGGLQPLVGSIHVHQTNAKLLPFIFDAIASIIVNNEDNARTVSSLGIVPVVVASLSRHKSGMEVVKSGCHTLAILSDVKGQASKIAFAGGVPIILSLLDTHPLYSDLHRVAAVVLLRMLQESAHVGREITCHEGVRILLNSLEKGGAQQDTVAAVTHILYTVTNPSAPSASSIEAQLWLPAPPGAVGAVIGSAVGGGTGTSTSGDIHSSPSSMRKNSLHSISNDSSGANSNNLTSLLIANSTAASVAAGQAGPGSGVGPQGCTALTGVVLILGQYSARRDVVRAACRLINNLSGYTNVVTALDRIGVLDKIFECASVHKDTKDVLDSATSLIKTIHRRAMPVLQQPSAMGIQGLVHVFKTKIADEDCVSACVDCMCRLIEQTHKGNSAEKRAELDASRCIEGRLWEHVALTTSLTLLQSVIDGEKDENANAGAKKVVWGKSTGKAVGSVLSLIEIMYQANKLDSVLYKDTYDTLQALLRTTTHRSSDLTRRIEKLLTTIDQNKQEKGPHKRSLISLKPPLPTEEGFLFNGVNIGSAGSGGASGGNTTLHSRENSSGNISTGPSPLAMGRKVKEYTGPDLSQDDDNNSVTSTTNNNNNGTKRGFGKSKSWGTSLNTLSSGNLNAQEEENSGERGGPVVTTTSTSPKKTLPQHPTKMHRRSAAAYNTASNNIMNGGGNGSGGGRSAAASPAPGAQSGAPRLLENWPNYLERLSTSSAMNRNYLNATQDASTPSRMQLSYESSSAAGRGLLSKCPTPVPYIVPPSGLGEPFAHSLTFDSDFESGNLLRAVQKGDLNYDLFLRSDLHTPGHTQWFYFAVANTHSPELVALAAQGVEVPPVRVKFNIVNFTKPDSLFNLGMRPVVYSVQDAANKNTGWVRGGSDISYYGNSFLRNNSAGEGLLYYYTLSFTMEFSNINDTTLIAYSYPYTMSDYRSHLSEILTSTSSDIIRQYKLCQTLSGEDCDLLVITNHNDRERNGPLNLQMVEAESNNNNVAFSSKRSSSVGKRGSTGGAGGASAGYKPALFLSCRVHPGETPASWMMKGMLEFLTSDCPQAVLLRQVFVIFIVPMLNPDGVIYGNNRCNLSGVDLNRQWKLPIKSLHPTVFHLKYFMQAQRKIRDISMYIDLHGHSRKYNVFMYGCEDKKRPKPQVRSFPKFFSMHNVGRKYVCYNDCSFAVKKGRESTARVVVSKEINIVCSFTLEATFCGSNYGPLKHCHMNIGHLQEVGTSLCDTILNFSISEGTVRDTLTVPHNIRAVQAIEKIIQNDGLGSTNEYSSVGYGGSGGMYTSGGTVGSGTVASGGMEESRERSGSNASANGESASGKGSEKISGEKRGVGAITINTTTNALTSSRRLAASAAAAADLAFNTNTADGEFQEQSATECDTATPTTGPYTSSREVYSRGSAVGGTGNGSGGGTGTGAEGGGGNGDGGEEDGNTSNVDTENENEEVGSGSDESDADGSDTESVVVNNNTSSNAMNNMYTHTMHHTNTTNANNSSMYGNNTGIGMLYNGGGGGGIHSSVSMNGMNEMMHTNNNSRTRMETLSAESGRVRLQNASSFNNGSTSGSASGMYGSGLVLTSPGLSKVLTSSGRNSILSNTNTVSGISSATADKINTIRALTTPTLRSHTSSSNTSTSLTNTTNSGMNNTLHSYTGSLTGRGAHVSIEYDGDSISVGGASGVSGVSGVNDGIASLSLAGVSAGTHASDAEALFSKTKKGKKKKHSLTNASTGGASGSTGASIKGEGGKDKEKSNTKEKGRTSKKSSSKEVMSLSQSLPTSGGGSNVGATSSSAPSSGLFSNDEYELFDSTTTGLNFGSTNQSAIHSASAAGANAKTSHSAGHTIVKAEYQDVVQRPDAVSDDGTGSSLAKTQAVATPFGLPKLK